MKCLLSLLIVFSLLSAGCGTVVVRGALNGDIMVAAGMVSIVHLTFASDGKTMVTVTVVTLVQSGTAQTLTFCGSQVNQFPMDTFVTTRFTPGQTCATVVTVSAGG